MTDIIIVGAGPAGLSAAIYALRAGKNVKVFEANTYGGQIVNTPDIENYPGIKHISGFEFATGLYEQAKDLGAELVYEKVLSIKNEDDKKIVYTSSGEYEAKAVILATGAKNRKLGVEKEDEFVGKGISYCATCDGAFFRNKDVAVQGGGNTALEDAAFLSNYCKAKENVEFVLNSTVIELIGETNLTGIKVLNKLTNEVKTLEVSGLFVAIGQEPDNKCFEDVVILDEKGYIKATENCLTNTKGIYTAGDCRTKEVRQLTTAAADGAVAALAAASYIK